MSCSVRTRRRHLIPFGLALLVEPALRPGNGRHDRPTAGSDIPIPMPMPMPEDDPRRPSAQQLRGLAANVGRTLPAPRHSRPGRVPTFDGGPTELDRRAFWTSLAAKGSRRLSSITAMCWSTKARWGAIRTRRPAKRCCTATTSSASSMRAMRWSNHDPHRPGDELDQRASPRKIDLAQAVSNQAAHASPEALPSADADSAAVRLSVHFPPGSPASSPRRITCSLSKVESEICSLTRDVLAILTPPMPQTGRSTSGTQARSRSRRARLRHTFVQKVQRLRRRCSPIRR